MILDEIRAKVLAFHALKTGTFPTVLLPDALIEPLMAELGITDCGPITGYRWPDLPSVKFVYRKDISEITITPEKL